MEIKVCLGSGCRQKGSGKVLVLLKQYLLQNGLADQVRLSASFCLGSCRGGIGVQVDGRSVDGVMLHRLDELIRLVEQGTDTG